MLTNLNHAKAFCDTFKVAMKSYEWLVLAWIVYFNLCVMKQLYFLVGCEESQAVCIELRKLEHIAYSCDLKPCSGGYPEWHLQMDVFKAIDAGKLTTQSGEDIFIEKWNGAFFFPDCTYLTVSANKWYKDQPARKSGTLVGSERREAREFAIKFAIDLYNSDIDFIRLENPIGVLSSRWRKPDQVLQPWMFGHGETKATCLWNKNLPLIKATEIVEGRYQRMHLLPKTKDRAELRSKTYPGIAKALAIQTVDYITTLLQKL